MNTQSSTGIIVITGAMLLAIILGVQLVTAQIETVLITIIIATMLACLLLGSRVWVLIPILGSLNVMLIRGFSTVELGQALFIGFACVMFLMRKLPIRWQWKETDWWALVIIIMVAQVYFRNPVGLGIFGAGEVGGRPYFIIALAVMSMFILGNMKINVSDLRWVMWLSIIGSLLSSPLRFLRGEFFAMDVSQSDPIGGAVDTDGANRRGVLNPIAITLARVITAYISPLRGAFHPLWAAIILISLAAATMSGFRNTVAYVGLVFLAGIAYHGGKTAMVIAGFLGGIALSLLALLNSMYPLPPNVQRTLSPLPGSWEERYVEEANRSTEWRIEMWKEALLTDQWISNKWLGDGLGMSRIELERSQALQSGAGRHSISGLNVHQENIMIDGNYHSGPVQTIRTVGYVGLFFLLIGMIRLAVHAHRLIKRCKGTSWFPIALFFGIPVVIEPIFFTLIYGTFGSNAAKFFIASAMIKVLHNNLPVPQLVMRNAHSTSPMYSHSGLIRTSPEN